MITCHLCEHTTPYRDLVYEWRVPGDYRGGGDWICRQCNLWLAMDRQEDDAVGALYADIDYFERHGRWPEVGA